MLTGMSHLASRCRHEGLEITEDWMIRVKRDQEGIREDRHAAALADLEGIRNADKVGMVVFKDVSSSGAWTEFGYALGLGKPVHVLLLGGDGSDKRETMDAKIFLYLATTVTCNSDRVTATRIWLNHLSGVV
jgi:nucleoside 2-deoxyribosyltransferase